MLVEKKMFSDFIFTMKIFFGTGDIGEWNQLYLTPHYIAEKLTTHLNLKLLTLRQLVSF